MEFCATWWTSRSIATSTIPRWCGGAICRLRFQPMGRVLRLSQKLRQQLERQFGPGYARWVAELGETRRLVLASDLDPQRKRELLHSLASREALKAALAEDSAKDETVERQEGNGMSGKVYLVGAGPGDPELLTVKALRLLRSADVVLHDDLIAPEILDLIPPTTQVQNVGKRCGSKTMRQEEINFLLVTRAASGLQVVRLKSGDPLIFGRAGEEIEEMRRSNIEYEIVPGVTSALGAAAAAGIPLTHRKTSSTLVLMAGHRAAAKRRLGLEPGCVRRIDTCRLHAGLQLRRHLQQAHSRRIRGTDALRNYLPRDNSAAADTPHDGFGSPPGAEARISNAAGCW